ncbi:MAG TPA: pantoate--beta-alanine ligase [Segetibacter sp.]|jgi:pantoate--beta-alanine ligase
MILFKHAFDLEKYVEKQRKHGKEIGFVPTMGALHAGHVSLLEICNKQTDISICSIFVNPTQFNDPLDFQKYPVTIADDILNLEAAKCEVLFLPSIKEIYPGGTKNETIYDLGYLESILEGEYRSGHFQGVSQVVHRLLSIVKPDKLFLGQKDFQQCLVIKKLVHQLQLPVEVVIADTLREPSGLGMSSRNMRLSEDDRRLATSIFECLNKIKNHYQSIPFKTLIESSKQHLLNDGFSKVDYVAIANAETLQLVDEYDPGIVLVALIAAFVGDVRLIDSMVLNPPIENIKS